MILEELQVRDLLESLSRLDPLDPTTNSYFYLPYLAAKITSENSVPLWKILLEEIL